MKGSRCKSSALVGSQKLAESGPLTQRSSLPSPSFDNSLRQACVPCLVQHERDSYRCARVFGDSSQLLRGLHNSDSERVTGWGEGKPSDRRELRRHARPWPLAELFSPTQIRSQLPNTSGRCNASVLTIYSPRPEGFAAAHRRGRADLPNLWHYESDRKALQS